MALLACTAGQAHAAGVDQTCSLSLTKTDAGVVNAAYPDEAAIYYAGAYAAVPGTRIRITGRFPHARYMSFNVYDVGARPLDALADVELGPTPGSLNPFAAGAERTAEARGYEAFIDFGPIPARRAPNTLYAGSGQNGLPNFDGTFIYRIYVPDRGRDDTGGVGLPTVTLETSDTGTPPPDSACSSFSKPAAPGVNEAVAASNGLPRPPAAEYPGRNPPTWKKFVNLPTALIGASLDNPYGDRFYQAAAPIGQFGGSGGYLSNIHNSYLTAVTSRTHGEVLVTRYRAPPFPDTRPAPARMPAAGLRYWSMCQNQTETQRFVACRTDDQTVRDGGGFVNYIVSTPGQRPSNATAACGATWMPWGPTPEATLIYRNMLAERSFTASIQNAQPGREAATMGDFFPVSRYYVDRAAFEGLGCRSLSANLAAAIPAGGCRDRLPPRSTIQRNRLRRSRRGLDVRGRALDRDCLPRAARPGAIHSRHRVRAVLIALARIGRHGCRYLRNAGGFTRAESCRRRRAVLRATVRYVHAGDASYWRLVKRVGLPPGRYDLSVHAIDTLGNAERVHRVARFRVR